MSPPKIYVRVFDCEGRIPNESGYVALIYVKRTFDALYYSAKEGVAYRREGDSTRRLSIEEPLRMIEAKRQPIVIVLARLKNLKGKSSMILEFDLCNIEAAPSSATTFLISVSKRAYCGNEYRFHSSERILVVKDLFDVVISSKSLWGLKK